MDCQPYCTSSLPWIWTIETLACSNQVHVSLLLDLLEKTSEISTDIGRNARELVSLKILESLFIQGARGNSVSSALSQTIRLDPSDHCEDVLRRILSKTSASHLKSAGPEMSKWDLQPFIEHKRSNLPKYTLKQLKDTILTGSHSFPASLKEQSGLPVGNQAEHEAPVKDGTCNGITPRTEGSDTNNSFRLPSDLPNENLEQVNRKRRATSESAVGNLCTSDINSVKKYKHDIIHTEEYVGGKLISSGIDRRIAEMCTVSVQHIERGLGRKTDVVSMDLSGPPKDDNNGCTSLKGLVCPDKVLPCGDQVADCVAELNNKSEGQGQYQNIEGVKSGKNSFCDHKRTNEDGDKFEQNIQRVGEVEEHVDVSNDNDGNDDGRTDIARAENASFGPHCTYSQDSFIKTNCRDENLLAGTSKRNHGEEMCSVEKKTCVEVMEQNEPSGDCNNQLTSSKGLVGNDDVVPQERQADVPNEEFDEAMQKSKGDNPENGLNGCMRMNDMAKFDQNVVRTVPTVDEAEDVDKSSDNDGYHDERINIDTKKKIFLSSQCTYSQDSLATTDWRELHLCMKCNKGGKLLSCSSDSCPLVIHKSCLGSNASFDTRGKFYCPFCAYSRAISKYMEVKKRVSLARKDLATFICFGPQQASKKHSQRSFRIEGNYLQQNDGLPKSNELNQSDVLEKVSDHQRRKKLEHEQVGPSELCSGYSPPFGGKSVDSTNRLDQSVNKDKQDGENMRQVSQSPRVHGQLQRAALAADNSHGETTSCHISETSWSEKHADVRSKKRVPCPSETVLPCERKCSQNSQSASAEELSEEDNESSGASKYFIRVRKQEKQTLYPAIPQLRRKRLPWTSEEEDTLREGIRLFFDPKEKTIPWKKILEFGYGVFPPSRGTMDLKDKWRNMCKASSKPA